MVKSDAHTVTKERWCDEVTGRQEWSSIQGVRVYSRLPTVKLPTWLP